MTVRGGKSAVRFELANGSLARQALACSMALAVTPLSSMPALAQDATPAADAAEAVVASAVPTDVVWILNSLLFLIGGFLVFWMAAGFAMLEAGLVRSKNVTMQLLKNVALFAIALRT